MQNVADTSFLVSSDFAGRGDVHIRLFSPIIVASLMAASATTLTATRASAYQELSCRRSCLATQIASINRCRSNCFMNREGARWYCYNICVGRGH